MPTVLALLWRYLALVVIHFAVIILFGLIFAPGGEGNSSSESPGILVNLLLMCALNSAVLLLVVRRSRMSGPALFGTVFAAYFIVKSVLSMVEVMFFLSNASLDFVMRVLSMDFLVTGAAALAAVWLGGKLRSASDTTPFRWPTLADLGRNSGRIALAALLYAVVYVIFGYFIAWQDAGVRAFYGGGELAPFPQHVYDTFKNQPGLIVFQIFRGVIWLGAAVLIMQALAAGWRQSAWIVALTFSVWMGSNLLIPSNPLMPDQVRLIHLIEVFTSNFLYGWLVVWLWHRSLPWRFGTGRPA